MTVLFCLMMLFDPGKSSFSVFVGPNENPYHTMAFSVMPGTEVKMRVVPQHLEVAVTDDQGQELKVTHGAWLWPGRKQPGHYPMKVTRRDNGEVMTLQLFVLTPLRPDPAGAMDSYQIGAYPDIALRDLDIYQKPKGLLKVDTALTGLQISPHFTLGQFLCKQQGDFPKFLLVRTRLLLKLEYLLALVNQKGVETDSFAVLSGYRTPFYNKAIGNVKYSRHQWGGAADIYVDVSPRDGIMDDLDKDGKIDVADAAWLYELFDQESFKKDYHLMIGGLGQYKKTAAHGPFVHVDVRGFKARWGH